MSRTAPARRHPEWQDTSAIDTMLDDLEVWAVVGLGGDPWRTAYSIAQELQQHGKKIVPIHPSAASGDLEVLGEKAYPTLSDVPFPIDVVDVFRRSEAAGEFADEAVKIGAKGVWFQMGVVDEAAYERTREAGLLMVMDACPSREWYYRD
jgi:predicted CoA-binding protein